MNSIKEGLTYFGGVVDCQEAREERWIQWEEEYAMGEAWEDEERHQMDELIWQQAKANW